MGASVITPQYLDDCRFVQMDGFGDREGYWFEKGGGERSLTLNVFYTKSKDLTAYVIMYTDWTSLGGVVEQLWWTTI